TGQPSPFREIAFELLDRVAHLAPLFLEHRLAEARARVAPFDLLLMDRHARDIGFELVLWHVAHEQLAERFPTERGHAPAEILVDELRPDAHMRAPVEILWPERHLVRKALVEIFADHRGFGDDAAILDNQCRNLPAWIDLHEFRIVLLELREIDEAIHIGDILLREYQQRFE